MKILVIEDERLLADSIKEMLERKGFQVEAVFDCKIEDIIKYENNNTFFFVNQVFFKVNGSDINYLLVKRFHYSLFIKKSCRV